MAIFLRIGPVSSSSDPPTLANGLSSPVCSFFLSFFHNNSRKAFDDSLHNEFNSILHFYLPSNFNAFLYFLPYMNIWQWQSTEQVCTLIREMLMGFQLSSAYCILVVLISSLLLQHLTKETTLCFKFWFFYLSWVSS